MQIRNVMSAEKKIYVSLGIGFVLFVAFLVGLVLWKQQEKRNRSIARTEVFTESHYDGIDVSHYQGKINWNEISKNKNIRFVYVKAVDGLTGLDDKYYRNIKGARKANKLVGAYHFLSSRKGIHEQFNEFKKRVKASDIDLLPMVDVEIIYDKKTGKEKYGVIGWTPKQVRDSTQLFVDLCKKHYGKAPLVYSGLNFYNYKLALQFDKYYLFIAKYGGKAPVLKNGAKVNIWQYTEKGRVKGIRGNVDLCRLQNDFDVYRLLK